MGSPLFDMFSPGPQIQTGNPVLNLLGNMPGGRNAIVNVNTLLTQTKQTPEQIVRSMLQSGQISQDQFNRAAQMANMITGKR